MSKPTFDDLILRQAEYDTKDDNFKRTKALIEIREYLNLIEGYPEAAHLARALRQKLAEYCA